MSEIPILVRRPAELKAAREALGLSADALARMLLIDDGRSVRRWEAGEHVIPGPVSVNLETAMDFLRQKAEISEQLEKLQSGEIRSTVWGGHDDTAETIIRLTAAKASLEQALITMTRQQSPDGDVPMRVHWYNLKRITQVSGQKNEWSLPGETSNERALAYFERDAGFNHRLEICERGDLAAEFTLEKRERLLTQFGASQRVRAGDLVHTFHVRRAAPLRAA